MKLFLQTAMIVTALTGFSAVAQVRDSLAANPNDLEEVVVTGQYNPQSVKKSVFQVKVITRDAIDRHAGNNLADLLNQTLNISIIPNASTGKSGVQLFGLDAQYFKILVDNIPVINDEGLGNNTDLTQINLDDILRIEIVEGSMGVEYGANAVSGIINIITKKSSKYKWELSPYLQEETVGDEYGLVDKGRHISSLKAGHNFSDKLYANAVVTVNNFTGFGNDRKGESWPENDGLRGYEWLPKMQTNAKSLWRYQFGRHTLFYKFEYFNEVTDRYNPEVRPNYNPATETTDPTATDDIFCSTRFYNHLNLSGSFKSELIYDISLSFQQQKRNVETYNYRIRTAEMFDIENFEYESRKAYYSKGSLSNFLKSETIDFQLGYELSQIDGFASAFAGTFNGENISRKLGSRDLYGSSEININNRLSLRPGIRAMFSSQFDAQAAVSLSSKYAFKSGYELRAIIGSSPRLPDYEELYSYFVDVNHNVQGNPNLKPEQGVSAFVHLNKDASLKNGIKLQNKFSLWYMNVKDRIELIVVSQTPLNYQFNNVDVFRTWGTSLTSSLVGNSLTVNAGVTFAGYSKVLDSQENHNDDFLYGFQVNSNVSYKFANSNIVASLFLKYNGPSYQFVQKQNEANETILVRGKQEGFTWIDATVKKSFLKDALEVTAGMRNIANITRVNTTATEGGAHNGPAANILMGYGRSGFLKLLYKLNF